MKCYMHQGTDAVGVCSVCGQGVCELCAVMLGGKLYCRVDADKVFNRPPPPPQPPPDTGSLVGALKLMERRLGGPSRSVISQSDFSQKVIEDMLGYSFNEEDLSPSTRSKLAPFRRQTDELAAIETKLKSKTSSRRIIVAIVWLFFGLWPFIWGIALFIMGSQSYYGGGVSFFGLLAFMWGIFVTFLCWRYISQGSLKRKYEEIYDRIKADIAPVISEVQNELEEAHRLRLRPEIVEYKIAADFSMKNGSLLVRCPSCGGTPDLDKSRIVEKKFKCQYCGNYMVLPEKLLNLL